MTNDVLKSFLADCLNKNIVIEKKKPVVFFDFAEKILNEKKKDISIITSRSYKQTILKVKKFGLYNAEKIDFNSFYREFSINFINYLEELDFALNTIKKHLKNLKTFLSEAGRMNLTDNKDFNIGYFTLKAEEITAIYLKDEELVKMFVLDLSKDSELELARDIFLIGCYTGQRVSDYNGLTKESIRTINGVNYFKIKQKKTKSTVQCPIAKEIREIMDKRYNGLPPKKILPQHLNIHIKAIRLLLEFEEKI